MIKHTILVAAALIALPATGWAQSQPSSDWNGNFQFRSGGARAEALMQADMIERADEGYYQQWTNYNTFYTTSNVGAITNTSIEGDNNKLNTDNFNCGDVSGSINVGDSESDSNSHGGGCD